MIYNLMSSLQSTFCFISLSFSFSDWYEVPKTNVLIFVVIFSALILYFIYHARKGRSFFVRRIAGLEAVEEAVGRATEMGKPILYVPGLSTLDDVATIAAINILGKVAEKTAEYDTKLIVPLQLRQLIFLVR